MCQGVKAADGFRAAGWLFSSQSWSMFKHLVSVKLMVVSLTSFWKSIVKGQFWSTSGGMDVFIKTRRGKEFFLCLFLANPELAD